MPAATPELVTRREAAIKKNVAALGPDADTVTRRKLGKKLRRAQRKRRLMTAMAMRRQGKPAEGGKEG